MKRMLIMAGLVMVLGACNSPGKDAKSSENPFLRSIRLRSESLLLIRLK